MTKELQSARNVSEPLEEWLCGMYVRIPMDVNDTPLSGEYRDFRLGQIIELKSGHAVIQLLEPHDNHRMQRLPPLSRPLALLRRCTLAAQASFLHAHTRKWGRVLISCESEFTRGQFRRYFVELGDEVKILSEDEIYATYNSQASDPKQQLLDYEFHSPVWKFTRDKLIEDYAALQTVTYGIEELVGARVMLLPHQAEVIAHILGDKTCRYMLADEVGLGKTIEACVILKGLRRRHRRFQTLIIVPATLLRQWYNELSYKFWLDFAVLDGPPPATFTSTDPGILVSHEALGVHIDLSEWLKAQTWELLIVDEAHNLRRKPGLYERIHALSQQAARVLVLSATPVQRRAQEYLTLLKLMHPNHYDNVQVRDFQQMLATQGTIRNIIAYLAKVLNPNDFDADEFQGEIARVVEALSHDPILVNLVKNVTAASRDRGLVAARETLQYISENYRIENRVIRNRRTNLQIDLPVRRASVEYAYTPASREAETLVSLHEYTSACLTANQKRPAAVDYCRTLFHAAFSSPPALLDILSFRRGELEANGMIENKQGGVGTFATEIDLLERLIWRTRRWEEETAAALSRLPQNTLPPNLPHRLVQVVRAVYTALRQQGTKVLIFSTWGSTLGYLRTYLIRSYGSQAVAWFRTGLDADVLQSEADRLQSDDTCRILLSDESGGEGRNFQIAKQIIHLDLPWTPAQVEQRIGRVDRLGRTGVVLSITPFARDTLEEDLFNIWHRAFHLFEQSMSGMEIVLEEIQDKIAESLGNSTQTGLANLLPQMIRTAEQLRADVEEERYFEEGAVDYRRRAKFIDISNQYRNGERLRQALLAWAEMAGLRHTYDPHTSTVVFDPTQFNLKSIENAKFARPPDMREALRRSGRQYNLVLRGTFDRELAVRREDIIFFAPGEIWTHALLTNALEADRGRCTAVLRYAPEVEEDWQGFELLYRFSIDPRPLYATSFHPTHLFRAQGYLEMPTYRLYISTDGEVINPSSLVVQVIRRSFVKNRDIHLGKRSGPVSPLQNLKRLYPQSEWQSVLERVFNAAESHICQELDFMADLADEAKDAFARSASGQRAAYRWLHGIDDTSRADEIHEYEAISECLVEGIARPIWQLESACFWILKPGANNGK